MFALTDVPTRCMLHDVIILVPFFKKKNHKFVSYVFPQKGSLTLTPGMGVGGDHSGQNILKNLTNPKESSVRKLFILLGHCSKSSKQYLQNIFIYTENDTKSVKRIINNNLWYKAHQKYNDTFSKITNEQMKSSKRWNDYLIIYHTSITHILYVLYILYFSTFNIPPVPRRNILW